MKQFTDSRVDSIQRAHSARTKMVELMIGEIVVSSKRAVRQSSAYPYIALKQYDSLISQIEKSVRTWLVTSTEKDAGELMLVIDDAVQRNEGTLSPEQVTDITAKINEEILHLKTVGFLRF